MSNNRKKKRGTLDNSNLVLKDIKPKTGNQAKFFDNYESGLSQVLLGYPGTGKTFLALYKAFEDINKAGSEFNKVVIVRSAVPSRDLGHLPGTEAEKVAAYELPYKMICTELFGRGDAYEVLKKHGTIEFMSTSYMRGITIDRAVIIADEIQNYTSSEADTVLTRGSDLSKIIFCGDILQRDITKYSEKDIEKFLKIITSMDEDFDIIQFGLWDIIRGGLCGNYIRKKFQFFPNGF
jgi:phosphate starvation-inducible PhoH-like protein